MAAIMAFALGCAPRGDFRGEWIGRKDLRFAPGTEPGIVGSLSRVRLRFLPADRFELTDGGIGKAGEVEYGSEGVTLRVEQAFGRAVEPSRIPVRRVGPRVEVSLDGAWVPLQPAPAETRNQG